MLKRQAAKPALLAAATRRLRRRTALIVPNVPNVRKAVRWNSPFYGIDGVDPAGGRAARLGPVAPPASACWIREPHP